MAEGHHNSHDLSTWTGRFTARLKIAFLGDQDDILNSKLRAPPLLQVLFCLVSMFCFICCMVSFSLGPVTLIMCMALVVFYGALGSAEGSAYERGYPSTNFLIPIGIGSAVLPLFIGVKIFVGLYAPYYLAVSGREYKGVAPVSRAAEYADAGIIHFTEDAALDTTRSFGLKGNDFTYCVAPVVSRAASVHPQSSGPKVSFWAVGRDCCGNRRDFECDGAGEVETRNAFTVNELDKDFLTRILVPKTSRPEYMKAVEAAKALHGLKSEDDGSIVLVRWASEPREILEVWKNRTMLMCALACGLYTIFITIVWTVIHMYFDRDIHKLALHHHQSSTAPRQVRDPFMVGGVV